MRVTSVVMRSGAYFFLRHRRREPGCEMMQSAEMRGAATSRENWDIRAWKHPSAEKRDGGG